MWVRLLPHVAAVAITKVEVFFDPLAFVRLLVNSDANRLSCSIPSVIPLEPM